jgi:hypothetical protein
MRWQEDYSQAGCLDQAELARGQEPAIPSVQPAARKGIALAGSGSVEQGLHLLGRG